MPRKRIFRVDSPQGRIEKRVFVGGDYRFLPVLREIADAVSSSGFTAIRPWDYFMPRGQTRDYSLKLLHNCRYAIFEITTEGGHLQELEHTKDFDCLAFGVYQTRDNSDKPPGYVTSMVTTYGIPLYGYTSFKQLGRLINDNLNSSRSWRPSKTLDLLRRQWLPPKQKRLLLKSARRIEKMRTT